MPKAPPLPTSPSAPDVGQVRTWLEEMLRARRFLELIAAVLALITRLRDLNTELTKRLAELRRARPKSETLRRLERQLSLPFGNERKGRGGGAAESGPGKPRKSRKGRHPGRRRLSEKLPRVLVPNRVPDEQRVCPVCGRRDLEHLGGLGVSCEVLNVMPAQIYVEARVDEVLVCPTDGTIISAPPPARIVEKGLLGDELIVEATLDKYLEHQPIERQSKRFFRQGAYIAPQTLGRSISACIDLLSPLAKLIRAKTREPGLLGTDASGLAVLDREASTGIRTGSMSVWTNARWVTFEYSAHGDSEAVKRFLEDNLNRTVQCDGASVFNVIERAGGKRPGCWAHGRRRFVKAACGGDRLALEALYKMAPLFRVERDSKGAGDNAVERFARRRRQSVPILEELKAWLDVQRALIPPRTPLGNALGYLHRQWKRLELFLEDGNIELTNNRRERELRQLVQGRKNWLFVWGDLGGKRTADVLTVLATCIAHGANPRAYLHAVTKLIVNGWKQSRLRELLPDRIPRVCPELECTSVDELDFAPELPRLPMS